jgi:hypothetical protein
LREGYTTELKQSRTDVVAEVQQEWNHIVDNAWSSSGPNGVPVIDRGAVDAAMGYMTTGGPDAVIQAEINRRTADMESTNAANRSRVPPEPDMYSQSQIDGLRSLLGNEEWMTAQRKTVGEMVLANYAMTGGKFDESMLAALTGTTWGKDIIKSIESRVKEIRDPKRIAEWKKLGLMDKTFLERLTDSKFGKYGAGGLALMMLLGMLGGTAIMGSGGGH